MARRFVVEVPQHRRSAEGTGAGRYLKVGGSTTDDLQEAQVIGWTKKTHTHWVDHCGYKLVPVTIVKIDEWLDSK